MYKCPVCYSESLDEPYRHYSYDICTVCGVEFGFDDAINEAGWTIEDWRANADAEIFVKHQKLRQIWLEAGSLNWWEETKKPDFEVGVSWFQAYWEKHPLEKEEWQDNLSSMFRGGRLRRIR